MIRVSQICTENLKFVALRCCKQALQTTKPKKVLAEMLLEIINTHIENVGKSIYNDLCQTYSQKELGLFTYSSLDLIKASVPYIAQRLTTDRFTPRTDHDK
uniref:Uncharacterized protein n=1 Tax=Knipowitschia caucasica TaxID=637954 RepID=A0AAV2MG19_KNICA